MAQERNRTGLTEHLALSPWGSSTIRLGMALIFAMAHPCYAADPQATAPAVAASELLQRCASSVHPKTMAAIIAAESKGHPFAIADAGPVRLPWSQRKHLVRSYYEPSLDAATARADALIAAGHTVSLGLAQINDRNLASLGLSVREVFEPCTNVGAGAKILTAFYRKASASFGAGERALRAAISAYNSGDWLRGERDGYVAIVYRKAGHQLERRALTVPAIGDKQTTGDDQFSSTGRSFTMSASAYPDSD